MAHTSQRRRMIARVGAALGGSILIHLIVAYGAMPDVPPLPREPEIAPVELVMDEPELPARGPPPPRPEPELDESPTKEARRARRPLLAALSDPRRHQPLPTEPLPLEPTPPEPTTEEEPTPVVVPWVPSPREAARRQALLDDLPPLTDEDRVQARVQGMMRGALTPRLNDTSPPPELVPDGQGNLVHRDGALEATIRPDGTVSFGTKAGVSVDEFSDGPSDEIVDMHTKIPGVPIPLVAQRASEADCAAGNCDDSAGPGATFRPSMDLNDLMLKARGEDPLAARKRRFLRLTEELRDQMADDHRHKTLSRSKIHAGRNFDRIWTAEQASFATKRRLLFRLWDECEEPRGEDDDRPEAAAGLRARRHIIGFIRQKLPPGSAEAYSPAELRRLNAARESRRPFRPYL